MALINCPECGGMVSDAAVSCPHCGYPLKKEPVKPVQQVEEKKKIGIAIFKCAEKWAMQSSWHVKREFEILLDGKSIGRGKMGDMTTIQVPEKMIVEVVLHGYFGRPKATLHPGVTTYVNIAISQLGNISLQVSCPELEKESALLSLRENKSNKAFSRSQQLKPKDSIAVCENCKVKAKGYNIKIVNSRGTRKMFVCKDCLKLLAAKPDTKSCDII